MKTLLPLASRRLPGLLLSALALFLLAACGITDPATPTPIPAPLPTNTAAPSATIAPTATTALTPTPSPPRYGEGGYSADQLADPTMVAVATAAAQRYHAHQTVVALTPSATPNLSYVSPTPEPTATIGLGLISDVACWFPAHFAAPTFSSCWHTQVNGAWIWVASGYEGSSEPTQKGGTGDLYGLLWVCPEPRGGPHPNQLYPAPRPDLHITAVDGPRITLASRDPTVPDTFVFDISTFQWVNPPPAPTATVDATATAIRQYGSGGWSPELLADPRLAAAATAASERFDAHQTAVALTPRPPTEIWIPPTPEPTATRGVGTITDIGCTFPRSFRAAEFSSCWHTNVNGAWMLVGSGHEGTSEDDIAHGAAGPADLHGLIWVCTEPCYGPDPQPNQMYSAPRPDLHITAVDGPRITLASRTLKIPDTFVFDISTFQWVNP